MSGIVYVKLIESGLAFSPYGSERFILRELSYATYRRRAFFAALDRTALGVAFCQVSGSTYVRPPFGCGSNLPNSVSGLSDGEAYLLSRCKNPEGNQIRTTE